MDSGQDGGDYRSQGGKSDRKALSMSVVTASGMQSPLLASRKVPSFGFFFISATGFIFFKCFPGRHCTPWQQFPEVKILTTECNDWWLRSHVRKESRVRGFVWFLSGAWINHPVQGKGLLVGSVGDEGRLASNRFLIGIFKLQEV